MELIFKDVTLTSPTTRLSIKDWKIHHKESWVLFCTDGTSISALFDNLGKSDDETIVDGEIDNPYSWVQVSLKEQQRLLEDELAKDDTDFLDKIDQGSTVAELISIKGMTSTKRQQLLEQLDLQHLANTGFRALSTGESRRVMLARAIALNPDGLLLDDPFAGLDIQHRQSLQHYLATLSTTMPILCGISRFEDMPAWVDKIALFGHHSLVDTFSFGEWQEHRVIKQLTSQSKRQSEKVQPLLDKHKHLSTDGDTIFKIQDGHVAYTDKVIFTGLNWQIDPLQHWQIKGPNGCGKSTLLGLIFGDHSQCYSNDIVIFGRQRGSGETIWQIKQQIGMVSSALHLQYRAGCSTLEAVISGFYDSIGLYRKPTKAQIDEALEWLEILHLSEYRNTPFRQLDYAQQRLALLARALIKHPRLLILDEPYQGLDYLGRMLFKNTVSYLVSKQLCQVLYVSHYDEDKILGIDNVLSFHFDEGLQCYRAKINTVA
ncbi:ATP-binding cassette domain-containing protein [Vibrio agarivorans]|uniref:ATP-binding cassette domain-containing protein n=1 Tax=Vibrio agarivorans TaxID=153622 RepID=UPI0025B47B5B|nr:ATP-binding cassette domain-containing protein [Vibrio agarivorans]MDN3663242.1 ATP-binding cassette domain-containing protein [Vibrio agarivorans]